MENLPEKVIKFISVYARTSTSNQEDQKTVEAQLSEVYAYAKKHNYVIVKEYIDEGWSGDILARPQLDQLRHDARSKAWQAVLIYDPDRLGRQLLYQQIVIDELKKVEIDILFVTMPPVTNASDKLMFGVRGLFAEYEKAKITERFRIGKVNRVKNNHVLTSEAPFGYDYIINHGKRGNDDYVAGHFEINEREAKIVKSIFSMVYDDHLTLRGVVRELQKQGVKPRKSKREVWNTSTLSTLLRNETYIGTAHWGASYAVVPLNPRVKAGYKKVEKSSRRMRPKGDWYNIFKIPPIIDQVVFDGVAKQLKKNFALLGRNKKNDYLLAGIVFCTCGHRRAGEGPQHGTHLYYRCTDRVYSFPLPPNCREKGVNARIADKAIWQRFKAIVSSPKLLSEQIERWCSHKNDQMRGPIINIELTQKEISKLQTQEDRLAIMYSKEIITQVKFEEYVEPIRKKIKEYEDQILAANLEEKPKSAILLPSTEQVKILAKKAVKGLENLSFITKRLIIREALTKVTASRESLQAYGLVNLNIFNDILCTEYSNGASTINSLNLNNNHVKLFSSYRNCWAAKCGEKHLI